MKIPGHAPPGAGRPPLEPQGGAAGAPRARARRARRRARARRRGRRARRHGQARAGARRHRDVYEDIKGGLAPDAYWRQTTWRRVFVIGAGPAVNIVAAFLLFVVVYLLGPTVATRTIHDVVRLASRGGGRPPARATPWSRSRATRSRPRRSANRINGTHGKPFTLVVERDGKKVAIGPAERTLRPAAGPLPDRHPARHDDGARSVAADGHGQRRPRAVEAHRRAVHRASPASSTTRARSRSRAASGSSSTPPRPTGRRCSDYIAFIGYISLALALLNLLPILPLDGGHIVMAMLERVRGRSFSQLAYLRYSAIGHDALPLPALLRPHGTICGG